LIIFIYHPKKRTFRFYNSVMTTSFLSVDYLSDYIVRQYHAPQLEHFLTPFSVVTFFYLPMVFLVHRFMRDRKPFKLTSLLFLHNMFLCLISCVLTAGLVLSVYRVVSRYGWFAAYCGVGAPPDYINGIWYWAYMFYFSKYYELFDTAFLLLRKHELTFLHTYHHYVVVLVCWLALRDNVLFGWITCLNNASVHVLMYYYYASRAIGVQVWWRKYLTSLQMIQFVIDVSTSSLFGWYLWNGVHCEGSVRSWVVANIVGISFFFLFRNFYNRTYTKHRARKEE